jgi:type II secretory pathway component GspD/PulD (secretin)
MRDVPLFARMKSLYALAAVLLFSAAGALHAQGALEIIPLKHRSAEQVIPILRPLVEPGGVVSGQAYQLILRASPRNLEELKAALAAIDTPQRRLLISVRFDTQGESARSGIEARGTLRSGDASISTQRFPAERSQVDVRIDSARSAAGERVDQRVQVLEGARAFIATGQSRPLTQRQVIRTPGGGTIVQDSTVIQDMQTGFEVVPRVSGDTVFLDIAPQRETPGSLGPGSVQSQRVSSSISARLGEWVELGGAAESASRRDSGLLSSREASAGGERRVWVRVEAMR